MAVGGSNRPRNAGTAVSATLGVLCVFSLFASLLMTDGYVKLSAIAFAGLMCAGLLLVWCERALGYLIAPQMMALCFLGQLFWLTLIGVMRIENPLLYSEVNLDVVAQALPIVMSLLLFPIGALIACVCLRALVPRNSSSGLSDLKRILADKSPGLEGYAIAIAILQLAYWPAALEGSGSIGYLVRVITNALFCAPLLAGAIASLYPRTRALWIIVLSVNGFLGLVVGARERALAPATWYVIGYIMMTEGEKRRKAVMVTLMTCVPLLAISSAIGVVRGDLGRGGAELFSFDRAGDVFAEVRDTLLFRRSDRPDELGMNGIGRMFVWANAAVVSQTPEQIPYTGFDDAMDEVRLYMDIAALSGRTVDDYLDAGQGNAKARRYGFLVNRFTSVDFGSVADSWARGGPYATLACGIGLAIFVGCCELFSKQMLGLEPCDRCVMVLVCLRWAMFSTSAPLLVVVRGLTLTIMLCIVIAYVRILVTPNRYKRLSRVGWSHG